MTSQPLSVRLNDATIRRLGARARRVHLPPRTLAQRYVEEGLRMDEHPLVRFADGPAGRRARLTGTGKDVWEVIAVVRDNDGDPAEAAAYLEIPLGLIQAAIAYYGAYTGEIDDLIEDNEQEAAQAYAAYLAGQAALRPVKLLLDEMLSPAIARELQARGHDVESIAGHPGREAMPDPDVLALARAEHRALATNNLRDFRPLHHEAISPGGSGHFGMIFIAGSYRRTKDDTGKIITALEAILVDHPGEDDLANGETWL